ncbi:CPBP family intramembrane metalloprotease [Pseudomonas aeruginosa]|nr:CPBP family intramembrane metalloprotease [Pseudomonas aeruginosa]ELL4401360.1 CPBP family intramembrane metalloprotease [Pseudomonas aeruginosa]
MLSTANAQRDSISFHVIVVLIGLSLLGLFNLISHFLVAMFSGWSIRMLQITSQSLTLMAAIGAWLALDRTWGGMPRLGTFKSNHFLAGVLALVVIDYLGVALKSTLGEGVETSMARDQVFVSTGLLLPVFIGSVILAPLMEELIFRGFLLRAPNMERSTRAAMLAIFASAGIFSVTHFNYVNTSSFVAIFFVGVVLGLARIASGGLLLPVALHMAANAKVLISLIKSAWLS